MTYISIRAVWHWSYWQLYRSVA